MDLNLKALIGVTYLIPIAITLRKIYAPNFDIPEPIVQALAKLEPARATRQMPPPKLTPASYALHI